MLGYLESVPGLARALDISTDEAQNIWNGYFTMYPFIGVYHNYILGQLKKSAIFPYIFSGRTRNMTRVHKKKQTRQEFFKAQRDIANNLPQGSAADLFKASMLAFARRRFKELPDADKDVPALLLQVHDEAVIEDWEDRIELSGKLLIDCMEHTVELGIPVIAKGKVCDNWGEGK